MVTIKFHEQTQMYTKQILTKLLLLFFFALIITSQFYKRNAPFARELCYRNMDKVMTCACAK